MRLKPNSLPTKCPVCEHGHTGRLAIKIHNEIASATGCRKYPERKS
jgi:hypothetical protein